MKNSVYRLMGLIVLMALPALLTFGCAACYDCAAPDYVDQRVSMLQGMIEENRSEIEAANGRIDSNAAAIANLQSEIEAVNGRTDSNAAAIANLQGRVAALEGMGSRLDDLEAAVRGLQGQRVVDQVVMEAKVLFEFNKYSLTDVAKEELSSLASELARISYDRIRVVGHADAVGTNKYNHLLGLRRAHAVAAYLVDNFGLDRRKIFADTYGEETPAETNETDEGRARNRRAEITVYRASLSSTGEM